MEIIRGDLLSPTSFESAIKDADFIIHIAGVTRAKRKSEFIDGNVVATQNLLEAATKMGKLKKFCYISSLTAVGPSPAGVPFDEQEPCHPISPYGRSKLEAERVCRSYATRYPIVILRPPTVYGPRDRDVLEIFKAARYGIQPSIGHNDTTLSMVYGPDLAEAIVESTISDKTTGKTYFVADPQVYSQVRLFDIVARLVGHRTLRLRLPASVVYAVAVSTQLVSFFASKPALLSVDKVRDLLQPHWVCSPEAIKKDIGFIAKTGAETGLEQTYTWYRDNKWL